MDWNRYICFAFLSLAQSFFQFCSPVFTKMPLTHNYTFSCYCCFTLIICVGFLESQKKLHQVRLHCRSCIPERQRIGMRSMNIQLFIKWTHTHSLNHKCAVSSHSQRCCLCVVLNMNSLALFDVANQHVVSSPCVCVCVCVCVCCKLKFSMEELVFYWQHAGLMEYLRSGGQLMFPVQDTGNAVSNPTGNLLKQPMGRC